MDASLATRKDFLAALKTELPDALRHLQHGNIAPGRSCAGIDRSRHGDLLAIFQSYRGRRDADDASGSALGLINQVLDEMLSEQEGDFDADTRWALAWFEEHGMDPGPFGKAETLSKAKNTAVNGLVHAGILEAKGGKVRLLDRSELARTGTLLPTRGSRSGR